MIIAQRVEVSAPGDTRVVPLLFLMQAAFPGLASIVAARFFFFFFDGKCARPRELGQETAPNLCFAFDGLDPRG